MRTAPLVSLFVVLNAVDASTTAYLTAHGAWEANPVMASILALGIWSFLTFKISSATLVAALLARFMPWSLKALCVVFVSIAAWQTTLCVLL